MKGIAPQKKRPAAMKNLASVIPSASSRQGRQLGGYMRFDFSRTHVARYAQYLLASEFQQL